MDWLRQKTTWAAIAAIVAAVGGAFTQELTWGEAVAAVFLAFSQIFQRQAVAKAVFK